MKTRKLISDTILSNIKGGIYPKTLFFLVFLHLMIFPVFSQNIGINDSGASPDESALLDLSDENKGFLITRSNPADIASPAFGLMTLSPSDSCLYIYNGSAWTSIGGGGRNCSASRVFPCYGYEIPIIDITSTTGKIWMDRNLGANQVATNKYDKNAYGDLYQWGRCSDGHEKRNSGNTATLSSLDSPGHGDFIVIDNSPNDWHSSQNNNLWQGVTGINNPCPTGYRVPTKAELNEERLAWGSDNSTGAINSPLKLPVAGARQNDDGSFTTVGSFGNYWSSTINGIYSWNLFFWKYGAGMTNDSPRAYGRSVRCIKD